MISERIDTWKEQLQKQSLLQGRQEGLQEGRREGLQEGHQEGLQKGQADILLRLLARRFGPLPADLQARVRAAGVEQIEQWADRALDAAGLAEVFGEH